MESGSSSGSGSSDSDSSSGSDDSSDSEGEGSDAGSQTEAKDKKVSALYERLYILNDLFTVPDFGLGFGLQTQWLHCTM